MKRFFVFVSVCGLFFNSLPSANPPQAFHKIGPVNAATGIATDNLLLSWEASSDVLVYEYCYDTSNDDACTGWFSAGPNTDVSLNGLDENTIYYWQVKAVGPGGTTYADSGPGEQAWWHFTTQASLPAAFHKLAPENNSSGVELTPTLRWEASQNAIGYEYCILNNLSTSCETRWISVGNTTSVTLLPLTNLVTYFWTVRAMGLYGVTYADNSPFDTWSFTTAARPEAFTKIAPENGNQAIPDAFILRWQASQYANRYEYCLVEGVVNSPCSPGWTDAGPATSVSITGLKSNTTYSWQVRATGPGGTTYANNNAFWQFITLPSGTPPLPFDKIAPTDQAQQVALSPLLTWGPSGGAVRYEYCITTPGSACPTAWISTGTTPRVLANDLQSGITYSWQVRAWSPGGTTYANGGPAAYWRFTTLVLPPGEFSKITPREGEINISTTPVLSWEASPGSTAYEYCIDTTNDSSCATTWINVGPSTSVQLSGLNKETIYYWQVRAINQGGQTYANQAEASHWRFTTLARPAPFNKSLPENMAASIAPASVTLGWTASSNLTSYEYCIDTSDDNRCNTTWVSTLTNTYAVLAGLEPSTTYFWQVRASGPGGTSDADNGAWWRFTTQAVQPPPPGAFRKSTPPDSTTGVTIHPTRLSWTASSNTTGYSVCIDTSNNNACNTSWRDNLGSTSASVDNLQENTTYYWQVRATGPGGISSADNGAWWRFTTETIPPPPPGTFQKSTPVDSATGITINPTRLSWNASSNVTGYAYCIDTSNNNACDTAWNDNLGSTTAAVNGLEMDTTYYWQVRASGPGGTSDADNGTWWRFTTQALPPLPPGAFQKSTPNNASTGITTNPAILDWTASSNATSYAYCIDTSDNNACNTYWRDNLGNTSAALDSLERDTTYYWQVRAVGPGGTCYADNGSWWDFTTLVAAPKAFSLGKPADAAVNVSVNPTLTWSPSAGASTYEYCLRLASQSACPGGWIEVGNYTSVAVTGLAGQTTYFWLVRAVGAGGVTEANAGAWRRFTTGGAPDAADNTLYLPLALLRSTN